MKPSHKKLDLSLVSFNAMGLFNFNSLHGIIKSRNVMKRLEKTAELLKSKKTDILAFQEVHTYSALKLLRKRLKSTYPFIAYKKFIYGPRGGLVVFSKFPIEKAEYVNFKKRGSIFNQSIVAHIIRNGVLACKIYGAPLYVLNTHLTPNMDHDWSKTNRFSKYIDAQIRQMATIVKGLKKKKYEIILAGDFNTAKDSYLYENFVKMTKAFDVFHNFSSPTLQSEYLTKNKKAERIDYIFLINQYAKATIESTMHLFDEKVKMKKGKPLYLSDHIALKIDISLEFEPEDDFVPDEAGNLAYQKANQ